MISFRKKWDRIPDPQLIEAYRYSDDMTALEELFRRYSHLVFGVCLNYLKNEEDSKDATMEIFEQLIQSLKVQHIRNFKNWLYTVTKNHCLMKLRKTKYFHTTMKNPEEIENIFMENAPFMHLCNEEENLVGDLNAALSRLNEAQRTCIRMFYFEEKTYRAIAATTGFEEKKVKSHIQNGKRNLKIILTQREGIQNVQSG
jgi:RNA polymerase sigma-70 factor (ECF subfamily)